MRRNRAPLYGRRFCGNTHKLEVHDLDREDSRESGCQIDEIIAHDHAITFDPDTLASANSEGYDICAKCIGNTVR